MISGYGGPVIPWWAGGIVSLVVLGAGTVGLSRLAQRPIPELLMKTEACDPTPEFKVVMDPYQALKQVGDGWTWLAQGYIQMHPCQGGTLYISGHGNHVGDDWPMLLASLDAEGLGIWKFDRQRELTIPIAHGGKLTVAFLNAYYNADTPPIQRREVYLDTVRFVPAR